MSRSQDQQIADIGSGDIRPNPKQTDYGDGDGGGYRDQEEAEKRDSLERPQFDEAFEGRH